MRKISLKATLLGLACLLFTLTGFAQITVSNVANATALAQRIVGSGITISNATLTGSNLAFGTFSNIQNSTNPNLQLDSGIVLSTGKVTDIPGAASVLASMNFGTPGDPQLNAIVGANNTLDAAVLQFDFVPTGDTVRFNYAFGSEEYPNFACTGFNDVFALFISGPGITGSKNIALVPNTNIPVAINSVNSGTPGSGGTLSTCTSMGPGSPFTQYYLSNSGNTHIKYNAFTKKLTAIRAVTACQTYHLKFVIADVGTGIYDSGVFIEARSLNSSGQYSISSQYPVNNTGGSVLVRGCQPGHLRIRRSIAQATPQSFNLSFAGTATNGVDVQTIAATATIPANDTVVDVPVVPLWNGGPQGTKLLTIYVSVPGTCAASYVLDSTKFTIKDYDTLFIAPHGGIACNHTALQITTTPTTYTNYQWTPATGVSNPAISNPTITPADNVTYTVIGNTNNCHAIDSLRFHVKSLHFFTKQDVNCQNGATGQVSVGAGLYWTAPILFNINNGAYGSDSTFSNLPVGVYTVHVKDATGCIDSMTITIVQAYPNLNFTDSTLNPCATSALQLTGTGGLAPYQFSVNPAPYTTNNVFPLNNGTYTINVKDANGCVATRQVNFTGNGAPSVNAGGPVLLIAGNPVQLNATASAGTYLWTPATGLNSPTVLTPTANPTVTTTYTLTVTSPLGCAASDTATVIVLNSCINPMEAFSPNGDGLNDTWIVSNNGCLQYAKVAVYNRYGAVIYQNDNYKNDWDGTYRSKPVPDGTYYFIITYKLLNAQQKILRGNVTILR